MPIDAALARIDATENERLEAWKELLRIPSVSTDPAHREDVARAAQWVAQALERAGLEASIEPTDGHPVVYAHRHVSDSAPTVLVYGHYDVQPADAERDGWSHPPFDPVERDGNLYARGASDDKGQMLCWVQAAEAWQHAGGAPVNLKFVIEGEEEIGSPHLGPWIERNRERLGADVVAISDMDQLGPGRPALTYGLRGLLYVELRVYGPREDLHSGLYGGAVMNPATALCQVLGRLHTPDGRVAVEGFYDAVRPLDPEERAAFARIAPDERALADELGVPELFGEAGYSAFERTTARPTLEINGIFGGFAGPGAKTVLPSYAGAKISCRLVPDQQPRAIFAALRETIGRLMPPGVRWDLGAPGPGASATGQLRRAPLPPEPEAAPPVLVERDSPYARAAASALEKGFGARPEWVRSGGSIPVVLLFRERLGLDAVLMGYGLPDDNKHGPDEKMCIADFHRGCRASAIFLDEVARLASS